MGQLTGKTVLIAGASSGIGHAAARLFAQEGANLVLTARRQLMLEGLCRDIALEGGRAEALAGDVRDEDHAKAAVDLAVSSFGGLDIAFNNVGLVGDMVPLADLPLSAWREVIDVNLTAAFLGAKYQLPAMIARGGGSLIFPSSFVGNTAGMAGMSAYAAAKAGVVGLARSLAADYGERGIRVNALLPGGTDTPMNTANLPGAAPGTREFIEGLHALKRMAAPEEIAKAALFLASGASSFVTGTALLADGGVSILKG
jgi:NAD(P)-dependent dehydrogenase (short-subunit alcohol dehydrogenase family)